MNSVITILGGNGFVGRKVIEKLLIRGSKSTKIYVISRSNKVNSNNYRYDDRVEFVKGNALHPEDFAHLIKKSTGVVHSIGTLLTLKPKDDPDSYYSLSYLTCQKIVDIIENESLKNKINFAYVSAGRGLIFPLSLIFSGYIDNKRAAEKLIFSKELRNINPTVFRPGVIKDAIDRPISVPIYHVANFYSMLEEKVYNKAFPGIGEKLNLPVEGTELADLATCIAKAVLGEIEGGKIYENKDMRKYSV